MQAVRSGGELRRCAMPWEDPRRGVQTFRGPAVDLRIGMVSFSAGLTHNLQNSQFIPRSSSHRSERAGGARSALFAGEVSGRLSRLARVQRDAGGLPSLDVAHLSQKSERSDWRTRTGCAA